MNSCFQSCLQFSSIVSNTLKMQLKRVNSTLLLKIIFAINERAHIFYNFDKSQKQIWVCHLANKCIFDKLAPMNNARNKHIQNSPNKCSTISEAVKSTPEGNVIKVCKSYVQVNNKAFKENQIIIILWDIPYIQINMALLCKIFIYKNRCNISF